MSVLGFPGGSATTNLPAMQEMQETRVWSLGLEDSLEEEWQPTAVLLPGTFHGQKSLVGYNPGSCKESYMTEWAHTQITEMNVIKVKENTIEKLKKKPMKRDHHKRAVIFYSDHRDKPYIALCFLVLSTLENNHFYNSQCPWDQHPLAQETEDYSWYWVWRYISLGCSHKVSTG